MQQLHPQEDSLRFSEYNDREWGTLPESEAVPEKREPDMGIPSCLLEKPLPLLTVQGKSSPTYPSVNAPRNLCISVHHLGMVVIKCLTEACGGVFLEGECYCSCRSAPTVGNYRFLCMCTELGSPMQRCCPCLLRLMIRMNFSVSMAKNGHHIFFCKLYITANVFGGFIFLY